jgi:hypothetical protein
LGKPRKPKKAANPKTQNPHVRTFSHFLAIGALAQSAEALGADARRLPVSPFFFLPSLGAYCVLSYFMSKSQTQSLI